MASTASLRVSLRRWVERAATIGLIVVPVLLIALWFTLHYKPAWYRPAMLDEAGMHRARREAVAAADAIGDRMVERKPFDVTLRERSVNEWIAALDSIAPDDAVRIPQEISDIAVSFDEGRAQLGGRYSGSWHAIISAVLTAGVSEDGATLWIDWAGVRAGSLPIPGAVIRSILGPEAVRDPGAARASSGRPGGVDGLAPWLGAEPGEGPAGGAGRVELENRFVWFNGRRPYRILAIRLAPGELHLRIEPL